MGPDTLMPHRHLAWAKQSRTYQDLRRLLASCCCITMLRVKPQDGRPSTLMLPMTSAEAEVSSGA